MREILSFIFGKLTDPLTLPIEPWKEWIILGVIGALAYIVAFRFVGDLYDSGEISGSAIGSILHWIVRLLVFVPVWFVTYWIIVIGQLVYAHLALTLGLVGGLIVVGAVTYFLIQHFSREART